MPKKTKKEDGDAEARELLAVEEAQKLIDAEAAVKEAPTGCRIPASSFSTKPTRSPGEKGRGGGPDVSREGVQRDLSLIVKERCPDEVRDGKKLDHVLFFAPARFMFPPPILSELQGWSDPRRT
jgi:ATP-dependent HslUV protease ATP-binding subunit HslU